MDSFAALMVIIACHADGSGCINEPLSVASYKSPSECQRAMPKEVQKAKQFAQFVYGDCIPVDPALLAGKPEIRRSIDPQKLAGALTERPARETAFASPRGDVASR
ncbi:hypothetical protein [Rhizobium sp. RU36D]|uniref:hypothetical protein n=1 Tax=Rhizobium sp. RU36D TaxID=1907415 RepID=UPI0009D8FC6D|nr:hypothetical protein [Rhizobium sp. RU36D]SMD01578.1 hypothetical protein SAMN05880593_11558 [Rhizobium sp. RU36D]